jgi:hypothetical protein
MLLDNKSRRDAFVQVFVSDPEKLQSMDSISIIGSPDPNFSIAIEKDLSNNSYSFILPDNNCAVLQRGKDKLDLGGKLVINRIDTIVLSTSSRVYFENDDFETDAAVIVIDW